MSRTLAAVPSALLLALLTACGGGDPDEADGSPTTSPGASSEASGSTEAPDPTDEPTDEPTDDPGAADPAPAETEEPPSGASGDGPEVEVLDPGAEPRVPFALSVEEGYTETSVLTVEQEVDAGQVVDLPAIEITLTNEVVSVAETVEVRATYDDVTVRDPQAPGAAELEEGLAPLEGLTTTSTLSPQGATLGAELDLPADLDPTVRQTLEQFQGQASSIGVAFPDEELGEGARWQVSTSILSSGVEIEQVSTYELSTLEGRDYELAVTVEQRVVPGSSQGVEVVGGGGRTTGTATGVVGNLTPSRTETDGSTTVRVRAGGRTQEVRTGITTTTETTVG